MQSAEGAVVQQTFPGKPIEFAKRVGSTCAAAGRRAVLAVVEGETAGLVVAVAPSAALNAGQLLREELSKVGARGGGSAEIAQGQCAAGQLETIVSALALRLG